MPITHLFVIGTNLKHRLRYGVGCLAGRGRLVSEFEEWVANLSLSDDVFVALLRRLAGQVVRTKSYPPPEGYDSWSDDAVHDLVNEVYARNGKQLGLKILERATSQASLERLLLATVENVLIDQAKATETGKLRRRLVTVLGADDRFVHLASPVESWGLSDGPQEPWQGDFDDLVEAALRIRGYEIRTWNTAGPTPGPVKQALLEVSAGVLRHANGAVPDQTLASVLRTRFVHIAPLNVGSLSAVPPDAVVVVDQSEAVEDNGVLQITAEHIWNSLTEQEQAVIAYVGQDPTEWARIVSMRPAEAALVVARTVEKVRLAVVGDDQAVELVRELRGLSISAGLGPPELRRLLSVEPTDERKGEGDG